MSVLDDILNGSDSPSATAAPSEPAQTETTAPDTTDTPVATDAAPTPETTEDLLKQMADAVAKDPENGLKELAKSKGMNIEDLPIVEFNKQNSKVAGSPVGMKKKNAAIEKRLAAKKAKESKPTVPAGPCLCGCGGTVLKAGSKFLPGHDARLNSICHKIAHGNSELTIPQIAIDAGVVSKMDCGHYMMLAYHEKGDCPCKKPVKVKLPRKPGVLTGAALAAHDKKLAEATAATDSAAAAAV